MMIKRLIKRLNIYSDENHPHSAQNPIKLNVNNMDDVLQQLMDKKISREVLNELRAKASVWYNRFFTAGHFVFSARDRFSHWKWMAFSFLQHYVTARSSEMIDGFRKLYLDNKSWLKGDALK